MRKLVIIALVLFSLFPAFANDAYVIPLSSPLYDAIDALYAVTGNVMPSTSRPWSSAEAENIFSRIDRMSLDADETALYERVRTMLDSARPYWMLDDGTFGLGTSLSVNGEYYYHTNTSYDNDSDWVWNYEKRKPFLNLEFEFSAFSWFYTVANAQYTKGRWDGRNDGIWYYDPDTAYPEGIGAGLSKDDNELHIPSGSISYSEHSNFNFPSLPETFEFDWPKRAIISFASPGWALIAGRGRMNWGNARIGNLLIDDSLEYHDALRFKVYTKNVFEYEVLFSFFDDDYSGSFHKSDSFKILMAHRISFRPASWISFSVSENVMYRSGVIEGQSLNPAFIFHNLNNRDMFNAIAWAELLIMPFKGFGIYAQAALDQGKLPQESASEMDAWGVIAGLEYTTLAGDGYFKTGLEFAYTTPLLYRRDKVDFIVPHRTSTQLTDGSPIKLFYVGFPYGGDTIASEIDISYVNPGKWSIASAWRAVIHGSMDMFESHNKDNDNDGKPNKDITTPSGDDISMTTTWTLEGTYSFPSIADVMDISLYSSISLVDRFMLKGSFDSNEPSGTDLQLVIGLSLSLL